MDSEKVQQLLYPYIRKKIEIKNKKYEIKELIIIILWDRKTDCDWDFCAMTCDESWSRMWENTWKAKGEARESLIVRVGTSSPSNAPSLSVLQIESAIFGCVAGNNCYTQS